MSIRDAYKPLQPAVKPDTEGIHYMEVMPHPDLEDFVYCFWQLHSTRSWEQPYIYRVVSDGCVDIFLNNSRPDENFVMGFCRQYTEFSLGSDFDYIGIRFLPAAFPRLFDIHAKEISDRDRHLSEVRPEFSYWLEKKITPGLDFHEIVSLLNQKLKNIMDAGYPEEESRLMEALLYIFKNHGHLDVEKDLKTGFSPRQLRRVFDKYIGTTPKAFCNVVRFQHVLQAEAGRKKIDGKQHYLEAGFYDQAHFIRQFKVFYGVSPSQAFD